MKDKARPFIPGLRFHWLTPVYDPLLKLAFDEERFRRRLLDQIDLQPGMQVLDLGCGTGTVTVMAKLREPGARVFGIDPDPAMLRRARDKAQQAGVDVVFDEGFAGSLPYPDRSFAQVLACMMLHHLARPAKREALHEAARVLRPDGQFHIVDFGPPLNRRMQLVTVVMRRLEETADHFDGLLPELLAEAGFQVETTGSFDTPLGPLTYLRCALGSVAN